MTSGNVYGEKLVNFMLKREQVFISFRSCYYLLYQCLVPDTREALSLLVQHYSVPKDFERTILSGGNPRVCNHGILNYLLIKLRTDKDYVKFYDVLKAMINHPELRVAVERIQRGIHTKVSVQLRSPPHHNDIIISNKDIDSMEDTFPLHEGALSVIDSDDNYYVSHTVTMVDVRSCARPSRSLDQLPASCNTEGTTSVAAAEEITSLPVAQQMLINNSSFAELQSHYSVLVRSMPDDYMNTVSQLERHLTGDHIGSILECADVFTANQRILDCLIEQLDKKEDVFDLCEKLSNITDTPSLNAAIEDLKKDVIISLKSEDSSDSPTNGINTESPPSLTPNNLSNSTAVVPAAPQRPLMPGIFYKIRAGQYSPRALAILKKHYHALWRSFPNDHMITLSTLCGVFSISDDIIDMITSKPTSEEANQVMLDYVIFITNGDQQMNAFCDLMAKIINNPKLSKVTSNLKKDCMDITLQTMLQSILQRNPLRTTDSSSSAQIEELTEDVAVVTTESSSAGDGHPQQDGGDVGASVIDHLPAGVSAQCRTMLHSYYDTLWRSFPQDHLITLSRLCDLLPVEERLVETIALYPTLEHDVANRRILNAALSNVKRDNELLGFCLLVEKLIASPNKAKTIENLKADCLKVMEKKQGLIKPSLTEGEQDSVADDVTTNANTSVVPTKREESGTSGSIDGADDETTQATDSRVRLLDSDPMVLHVLPSTVSDDGIAVLRKHYHMLLASLPDDHVTTVSILSETVPVDEMFFSEVISFTDHSIANEKILIAMILMVNRDTQFKGFAQLAKLLAKEDCKFSREMLEFDIDCVNIEEKATDRETSTEKASSSGSSNDDVAEVEAAKHHEPRVFQSLSFIVSPECRIVLKKYYNFLLKSFPKDHMTTYGKLINAIKLPEKICSDILSSTTSEEGNKLILHILILGVNKDKTLMQFQHLVDELIDNPKLLKIMKVFKNECEKAVEKCMANIPATASCSIVNDFSQPPAQSQVASTASTNDPKTDVVEEQAAEEVKGEGDKSTDVEAKSADVEADIFVKLSSHQLSDNGIAVLKKHYRTLLKSLPEDHMVTLGRLCKAIPVDDETIDRVISCEDSSVANKEILHILVMTVKNDNSLLDFCNSLETILQELPMVLAVLRNDCLKVIQSEGDIPLVPASIDNAPATVTMPRQSLLSSLLPATTTTTIPSNTAEGGNLMFVFSLLAPNQLSPKGEAILRKYYLPLWRAFPEDYMTSLAKISAQMPLQDDTISLMTSHPDCVGANKSLLDIVILFKGSDNSLMEFCLLMETIIGDEQKVAEVVEPLRQECLQLMIEKNTGSISSHPTPSATSSAISAGSQAINEIVPVEETCSSQKNVEDTRAALRTFDEHLHLMALIEPCCIQDGLKTSGLIANSSLGVMDDILRETRSCIEHNGAEKFLVFINLLQAEGRYVVLACHIFNKYLSYGGHKSPVVKTHQLLSDLSTLPVQQLLEQLRWHHKQIVSGLQYQCPMPLPDYCIQRDQLLEGIVNKLTDDDGNPTVGSTVTITGIGGIGKSTLAKALCHDVRLRSYFLDGFLWIRLGPLPVSPAIRLGQLYHLLTNKTEVGNQTFFTDKLQSLVANHLHKLLVIIDDVWEVSDALVYTQVFNGCEIVMTTRRDNVNKLIPSKMCITIERMNEEEAIKLLTYNLTGQSEDTNLLAQNLLCWPLLLKLVQGQLSICVREQHKSLPQAIDQVEEMLKAKGFNAPDVDRRSAVLAVVESSIGLLNSDETNALRKLVLSAGFSIPFPLPLLPAMLKVNSEEIEKLCGKLLRLGLISQCLLMTDKAIPSYEVHPIIAQHVMDHMTFESPVKLVSALDLGGINVISTVLAGGDDANISYHCLATVTAIDAIILPNHIKSLFILMKCLQHEIRNCVLELSVLFIRSAKMDLAQSAIKFKDSNAVKCIERLYQSIREDCKNLHNFLVNDRHEQAVEWITSYVKNHPLRKTLSTFTAFVRDLLHKCHDDSSFASKIKSHTDKIVLFYKTTLQKHSEHVKILLRKGLTAMISSGNVTTEQYKQLLDVYSKNLELSNSV